MGVSAMLGGAGGHVNASKMRLKCVSPTQHSISHRSMKKKNPQFQFYFNYYWVRLKGFMWLRDFLPIFPKIAVTQWEAVGQQRKFKTMQAFQSNSVYWIFFLLDPYPARQIGDIKLNLLPGRAKCHHSSLTLPSKDTTVICGYSDTFPTGLNCSRT